VTEPLWKTKANSTIAALCFAAWDQANPKKNGRRPKKHKPYCVPKLATEIVKTLGLHNPAESERETKALLLHYNFLHFLSFPSE
jgi:hypothetical protein